MDNVKKLIESSIELACEQYNIAKVQYDQAKNFDRKQQALARHFSLPRERLSELKIHEQDSEGVELNNVVYCLEKFISEQAQLTEESNYENERSKGIPVLYPIKRELEIDPGVFIEIWAEVTLFFKWQGNTYCVGFKPDDYSPATTCQIIAVNVEAFRAFVEAFREYRRQHHYLKGKKFIGLAGKLMPLSSYGWSDIVLSDGLAERIRLEVDGVLRCAGTLARYGLNSKRGFILAGEPGNGKTLLLKILANQTNVTCILVPFTKDPTERSMSRVFNLARRLAPTMLILEDVDLYGEEREHARDGEYLGELMNELDGMIDNKEIIVFATTNHLAKVEKALQNRPGRFDRVYKIMNPDFKGRCHILKHFINLVPNQITDRQIEVVAESFSGFSGAYLKESVNSGFAQAILRNENEPVLVFTDLLEDLDVLKHQEKRSPMGFDIGNKSSYPEELNATRNKA
ncbi:MAG: ATP-binding protein [Candidatus Omnitrophica bacterium]|nr:ATP-binding protein [Candidatus Omnitrophota bacterium]